LAGGQPGETHVERLSANTLRVTKLEGLYGFRAEARGKRFALKPGDKVTLSEMTIEVVELNREGMPSVCDFVFARPLEAPKYRWQIWQDGELRTFELPRQGGCKLIADSNISLGWKPDRRGGVSCAIARGSEASAERGSKSGFVLAGLW
jgi:hypothetical protein